MTFEMKKRLRKLRIKSLKEERILSWCVQLRGERQFVTRLMAQSLQMLKQSLTAHMFEVHAPQSSLNNAELTLGTRSGDHQWGHCEALFIDR
jgi:hypothetical protein